MKTRQKVVLLIITCSLIIILAIHVSNDTRISGWNDFKKGAMDYSFVRYVSVNSIEPPCINIDYTLHRKINRQEVDKIFKYTKKYILSEKVFSDLQKRHIKKYNYSFCKIHINFIYNKNRLYQIALLSKVDGEPSHNDFNSWEIEHYD